MGLAVQSHLNEQKYFPTGGWGYKWTGDADRGFGRRQPGGFFFNLLPFMEFKSVHDMCRNTKTTAGMGMAKSANAIAMGVFSCPSRRAPAIYPALCPAAVPDALTLVNCASFNVAQDNLFHGDYKANAGHTTGVSDINLWHGGPGSWADAETNKPGAFDDNADNSGIVFQRSQVAVKDVVNGTAHTYIAGEKCLNPDKYGMIVDASNPRDYSDDQPILGADDYDIYAWGSVAPMRDRRGMSFTTVSPFGSAHRFTFNMLMCDGSTKSVSYNIAYNNSGQVDLILFQSFCCRNDRKYGITVTPSKYPAIDSSGY